MKKISLQKINAYFYVFTAVVVIVISAAIILFLYRYFYQAILKSEVILVLQGQTISEAVDNKLFSETIKNNEEKISPRQIIIKRNVFISAPVQLNTASSTAE